MRTSDPACSRGSSAGGGRTLPWTVRLPLRGCFRLPVLEARVPTAVRQRKSPWHQGSARSARRRVTLLHHPRSSPWPCLSGRMFRLLLLRRLPRNRRVPNRRFHPLRRPSLPCPSCPRRPILHRRLAHRFLRRFPMFLPLRFLTFRRRRCRMSPPFPRSRFLCRPAVVCLRGCRGAA